LRYLSAHYVFPVSSPPLRNGIVCVDDDGCIVDVIDTGGKLEEREKLEFYNGILVPGFINAHCHLELSHLQRIIEKNSGLPEFISSIGKLRRASDETILAAAKAADGEMWRNGIVAVGDISNNACTLPIKRDSPIWYRTFVEVFGLDDSRSEEIFTAARQVEQEYRQAGIPASIVPHAMYSMSQALWNVLSEWYDTNVPHVISMHHHESSEELTGFSGDKGEPVTKTRNPEPETRNPKPETLFKEVFPLFACPQHLFVKR
jgi:cytosine/adenosine deaminase-related metal-dependent hydrolase